MLAAQMALLARVLVRQGFPSQARKLYARAVEFDRLPHGSTSTLYDVLARIAGIERAEALYLRFRGA